MVKRTAPLQEVAEPEVTSEAASSLAGLRKPEITLHQLRVFWAVAHSETLTRAAKHLGLAQPSLSQQLSKLEATVGAQLFHRRSNEMVLTQAGMYLRPKAEQVLRHIQDLEDGLQTFGAGGRTTIRLAGINSMLRVLLPPAISATQEKFPEVDFDIEEAAPGEILELLYGRRVNIGLLAANSVAPASVGFQQVPLLDDPYVLVVPEHLSLDGITDPERDLSPPDLALLRRAVQFSFGTSHSQRVEEWYAQMLPGGKTIAQCRSFEVAISLVAQGAGVCLAPLLSTLTSAGGQVEGVRRYAVDLPPRQLVALVPSQYRRSDPYRGFLASLAGAKLPTASLVSPTPAFLRTADEYRLQGSRLKAR